MTPEQLLAEALAAAGRGDFDAAADAFERAANDLPPDQKASIASALESVIKLRIAANQAAQAALSLERLKGISADPTVELRLRAELADKEADLHGRRMAWQAVLDRGARTDRALALTQLAHIARLENDHEDAATQFAAAAKAVDRDHEPLREAELRLEAAIALTTLNNVAQAEPILDELDASLPVDDGGLRARIQSQRGLIAVARDDLAGALSHAERARDLAVGPDNVMTYLAASTLIAGVHQAAGRLVDAYDALASARESLGDLLGPAGRDLVAPAIQLFEQRLGATAFQEVWERWVARRQTADR
ncbi:MAG: hypothetical protein AB7P03_18405 [Kofleriaceae bacterium]